MIFGDFLKALGQMGDPRFRRVIGMGVVLAFALLVAVYAAVVGLIELADPGSISLPFVGPAESLNTILSFGSLILMLFLSVFLMIPVASAITSLFLDDVARAVEDKHFPQLPVPPKPAWQEGVRDTLMFGVVLIGANILAFIAYAIFPFAAPFIFYAMNGYLLGREYFYLVAVRREGRTEAIALRKAHSGEVWLAGCLMAVPLSIPLLNLFIPVLGAATFTHLYHRLAARP